MVSLLELLLPYTHANEVTVRLGLASLCCHPPVLCFSTHSSVTRLTKDPDPTGQPPYSREPIVFVFPLCLASHYSMVLEEVVSQGLKYPSSSPFIPAIMLIECMRRAVFRAAAIVTAR